MLANCVVVDVVLFFAQDVGGEQVRMQHAGGKNILTPPITHTQKAPHRDAQLPTENLIKGQRTDVVALRHVHPVKGHSPGTGGPPADDRRIAKC